MRQSFIYLRWTVISDCRASTSILRSVSCKHLSVWICHQSAFVTPGRNSPPFSSSSAFPLLVIWTLLLLVLCVTLEHLCFNPTAYQFASVAAERWASAAPVYVCRSAAVREHRRTKEETACRSWRGEEGWRGPERSEKRSWVANWRHWWDFALCLIFEKISMQLRSCRVFGTEVRCLCWTSDHLWPFHQCQLHLWRCFKVLSQTLKMDIHNKVEISNEII